jgi:NADPH-dependent glutamate synthase beta subunit-like oxidoreductase
MAHRDEIVELLGARQGTRRRETVIIVGAGPAGLAGAWELAMQGCSVRVVDALDEPGGMLLGGIPPFRLPRAVVAHDVGMLEALGITITGSVRVGEDVTLEEVGRDADAIIVATGAWRDMTLGVPGEQGDGCLRCLDFLGRVNRGTGSRLAGRVVVIGGGNAAVDTARSALRLGPERVQVIYRRSRDEMPASADEVAAAVREGVEFRFLEAPTRIRRDRERITGVELVRMELGESDDSGRRRAVPVAGSEFVEPADIVIPAIGQMVDCAFLDGAVIEADTVPVDASQRVPGYGMVFAAGDAVSGPSTVVAAMASGKAAAQQVTASLEGR